MVIDEIQRAPELLQAIKKEVDENPVPGRFLLTGSASIQSSPGVTESLAGRVAHRVARPMAPLSTFLVGYALGAGGGTLDDLRRRVLDLTAD